MIDMRVFLSSDDSTHLSSTAVHRHEHVDISHMDILHTLQLD